MRRWIVMSARSRIHPSPAGDASWRPGGPAEVVDSSAVLEERLRRAVGFRVDGPEGRIGTLRAVVPGDVGAAPQTRVDVGLFVRREVAIPLSEVRQVDPERRRVVVGSVPRIRRPARAVLARQVRRYLRAADR
jgi:hypothetical protein